MAIQRGERVEKLDPVQVAKAALCEAGRVDLAERVHANRAGWPSIIDTADSDRRVVVRAFWLAHRSTGHRRCFLDPRPAGGIVCHDCEDQAFLDAAAAAAADLQAVVETSQ